MGNLFGTYIRNLDEKGRLQIPARLFGVDKVETLYALRGLDGCLAIYTQEGFDRLMDSLKGKSFYDEEERAYIRLLASSVNELGLDSHGRIQLGRALMADYRLEKEVTLIGAIDHLELWDSAEYARYQLRFASRYEYLIKEAGR